MASHIQQVHQNREVLTCNFCDRKCYTLAAMAGHMRAMHGKPYKCHTCFAWFTNDDDRQEHSLLFHGGYRWDYNEEYNRNTNAMHASVEPIISKHSPVDNAIELSSSPGISDISHVSSFSNVSMGTVSTAFTYDVTGNVSTGTVNMAVNSDMAGTVSTEIVSMAVNSDLTGTVSTGTVSMGTVSMAVNSDDGVNGQDEFSCGYCKQTFSSVTKLLTHMSFPHIISAPMNNSSGTFNPATQIRFLCQICGHDFNGSTDYEKHAKEKHSTFDLMSMFVTQQTDAIIKSETVDSLENVFPTPPITDKNCVHSDVNTASEYYLNRRQSSRERISQDSPDINSVAPGQSNNSSKLVTIASDSRKRHLHIDTDTTSVENYPCQPKRIAVSTSNNRSPTVQGDELKICADIQRNDHVKDICDKSRYSNTVCGICKCILSCKQDLYTHINVVHGIVLPEHSYCSLCGCHMVSQNDLTEHMSVIHKIIKTNDKPTPSVTIQINRDKDANTQLSEHSINTNIANIPTVGVEPINRIVTPSSNQINEHNRNSQSVNSETKRQNGSSVIKRINEHNRNINPVNSEIKQHNTSSVIKRINGHGRNNVSVNNEYTNKQLTPDWFNENSMPGIQKVNKQAMSEDAIYDLDTSISSACVIPKPTVEKTYDNEVILVDNATDIEPNQKEMMHFISCPKCGLCFDVVRDLVYHMVVHDTASTDGDTPNGESSPLIHPLLPSVLAENENNNIIESKYAVDSSLKRIDIMPKLPNSDLIVIEDDTLSENSGEEFTGHNSVTVSDRCLDQKSNPIDSINNINRNSSEVHTEISDILTNIQQHRHTTQSTTEDKGINDHFAVNGIHKSNTDTSGMNSSIDKYTVITITNLANRQQSTVYKCSVCGSAYNSQQELNEHIALHGRVDIDLIHPKVLAAFTKRPLSGGDTRVSVESGVTSQPNTFPIVIPADECANVTSETLNSSLVFTSGSTMTSNTNTLSKYNETDQVVSAEQRGSPMNMVAGNFTPTVIGNVGSQQLNTSLEYCFEKANNNGAYANNYIDDDISPVACLRKHIDTEDPTNADYVDDIKTCDLCGVEFDPGNLIGTPAVSHRYLILQHLMRIHNVTVKMTFRCKLCGAYLSTNAEFAVHIQKHEELFWHLRSSIHCLSPVFYCETCLVPFSTINEFASHIKTHENHKFSSAASSNGTSNSDIETETNVTSDTSNGSDMSKKFTVLAKLRLALSSISGLDTDESKTTCDICGSWIPSRMSIAKHLQLAHNVKIVAYHTCKICDQALYLPLSFNAHLRQHEMEAKIKLQFCILNQLLRCTTCSVLFHGIPELLTHMRNEHKCTNQNIREHRDSTYDWIHCKECKDTIRSSNFAKHIESHVLRTNYARVSAPPLPIRYRSTLAESERSDEGTSISRHAKRKQTPPYIERSDASVFTIPSAITENEVDERIAVGINKTGSAKVLDQEVTIVKEVNYRKVTKRKDLPAVESTSHKSVVQNPTVLAPISIEQNKEPIENKHTDDDSATENRVLDYIKTEEGLFEVSVNEDDGDDVGADTLITDEETDSCNEEATQDCDVHINEVTTNDDRDLINELGKREPDDILVISDEEIDNSEPAFTNCHVNQTDLSAGVNMSNQSLVKVTDCESEGRVHDAEVIAVERVVYTDEVLMKIDAHGNNTKEVAKQDTCIDVINRTTGDTEKELVNVNNEIESVEKDTNEKSNKTRSETEQKMADLIESYLIGRFQLKCKPADMPFTVTE